MNKLFLYMIVMLSLVSTTFGGDFTLDTVDASGAWYTYSGVVDDDDATQLRGIMKIFPTKNVFITINSGGGSAFGGITLFWEAERWSNLVTIAGKDYGAWSAAAMFWLGSPRDWFEGAESKVGFHQAYCNPIRPPGCDLTYFRARMEEVFNKAGYNGRLFDDVLTDYQTMWGISGWAVVTDEGWMFYHSVYHLKNKLAPTWVL